MNEEKILGDIRKGIINNAATREYCRFKNSEVDIRQGKKGCPQEVDICHYLKNSEIS